MSPKTVLVIEDSPDLADSLHDMLEMHGLVPLIARNGRDGIALALEHHPDLIILDIQLPDISGYQVYQKIREDSVWGKTAKLMILTASESLENISKNVDLPLKYVLFKPDQSIAEVIRVVQDRLED